MAGNVADVGPVSGSETRAEIRIVPPAEALDR
jgi:hypothetical protein